MKRLPTDTLSPYPEAASSPNYSFWQGQLALGFERDKETTRLVERAHVGPLRVQKPLYPEGDQVCHAIVVHPPGGVVGGDQLSIRARVGDCAAALLTTPGAAKWYKANGHISRQEVRIDIGAQATLEWLPQETIFFDAAHVRLDNTISMGEGASYIGCEILCFGRTASGESFASGKIEQRTSIRYGSKLVWFEQATLAADSAAMGSPLVLGGTTVCATLIAVGKAVPAGVINAIRQENDIPDTGAFGVSQLKSVVVARYLGDSGETARHLMIRAWRQLRPALAGREAVIPRIWNT